MDMASAEQADHKNHIIVSDIEDTKSWKDYIACKGAGNLHLAAWLLG